MHELSRRSQPELHKGLGSRHKEMVVPFPTATVRSQLECNSQVWAAQHQAERGKLGVMQRKATNGLHEFVRKGEQSLAE